MKKILSIALAVCMLASVLVMPASATLPTSTTQSARLLFSEDFNVTEDTDEDGKLWDEASSVLANPTGAGSNGGEVDIVDGALKLKFPEYNDEHFAVLPPESGSYPDQLTLLTTFGGTAFSAGWGDAYGKLSSAVDSVYRPRKWTLEFDAMAVENLMGLEVGFRAGSGMGNGGTSGGVVNSTDMKIDRYASIIFNPLTMPNGETNTFKVTVDEGNRAYFNSGSNTVDQLKDNVKVWKKAEGSNEYTLLTYGEDYKITANQVNKAISFGLNAANSVWGNAEYIDDLTDMCTTNAATYYVPAWGVSKQEYLLTEYNIDNVFFYNEEPGIFDGVHVTYDMETVGTSMLESDSGLCTRVTSGDNSYMKITNGMTGATGSKASFSSIDLNDEMTILVDVYNNSADANLSIWYTGPYHNTGTMKRDTGLIIIPADAAKAGKWYTYKIDVRCTRAGGASADPPIYTKLYCKEKGSDDPFVLVGDGEIKASGTGQGASNWGWLNEITFKYTGSGEWFIDNLQVLEKTAIAGDVSKSGGTYTVNLNVAPTDTSMTPIVAVYNSNDILVDMGYATADVTSDGKVAITVSEDSINAGGKVMLYMWDTITNGYPLNRVQSKFDTVAYNSKVYTAMDITDLF